MDKLTLRKAWLNELRSGKYEQGSQFLNYDGRFCCLGIACEVFLQQGGSLKIIRKGRLIEYNDCMSGLPLEVQEAFGLLDSLGYCDGNHNVGLAIMNDNRVSFAKIADEIEQYPERYFFVN